MVDLDLYFGKSGERVVSRVLSATNEEGRVKGENSIKLVTDKEDAIDADDNDEKLNKSSNDSDQVSEVIVSDIFTLCFACDCYFLFVKGIKLSLGF